MPMFHVYGLTYTIRSIALGMTMLVMTKFDFDEMLSVIQKYRVTHLPASPPIVIALAKSGSTNNYDLSSLRQIHSGGAPLGKEVIEEIAARFHAIEVRQAYGLTESSGRVILTKTNEENKRYGIVGLLSANVEAKVVDTKSIVPWSRKHEKIGSAYPMQGVTWIFRLSATAKLPQNLEQPQI